MSELDTLIPQLLRWSKTDSDGTMTANCVIDEGLQAGALPLPSDRFGDYSEVADLWLRIHEAWLFYDLIYGQGGLHLFSPDGCIRETRREFADRPGGYRDGDLILGEFIGDSDLLAYSPAEGVGGQFLVVLPLDSRDSWYKLGRSMSGILAKMLAGNGGKYWDLSAGGSS